ncbi:MAG: ABC transporter permease [Patescibacteria group bacterium]
MTINFWASVLAGSILSATSVLYATLGEVIEQRAGIVNLGLEGIILMGAVAGFAVAARTGDATLAVLAAALAGVLFNMIFGFLVITCRANQLASGLALMFCGFGLSALLGTDYVGSQIDGLAAIRLPFIRSGIFDYDILVYLVVPVAVLVYLMLYHTRFGLRLRATGENAAAAFAAGLNPTVLRYEALILGGLLGGLGGAHLSLAFTKTWAEGMSAGRGFIAVALVIFSKWHPLRAIFGALLFGGAVALQLQLQARGARISPFLLDMLPYLLSLGVLLVWGGSRRHTAPAGLGQVYRGTE